MEPIQNIREIAEGDIETINNYLIQQNQLSYEQYQRFQNGDIDSEEFNRYQRNANLNKKLLSVYSELAGDILLNMDSV
jgi:hypothetical protein